MTRLALAFTAACLLVFALAGPRPSRAGPPDGAWSDLAPPERAGHAAIYDPLRDRMVIFGGYHPAGASNPRNDTWILALTPGSTWTQQATTGSPPAWSNNFTALYDPLRDRMLLLLGGGHFGVWALSLASMTWEVLTPIGSVPVVAYGASCTYDPLRDRVLVFGGDEACLHRPCPHNEVWSLSLAGAPTWSLLDVAGAPPPPRFGHTAIYDPVRDRMIAFAGAGEFYSALNDAWALDLSGPPAWLPLAPSGLAPPPSEGYLSSYDPAGDRMLVSGVSTSSASDLWALSLANGPAWASLAPTGSPPGDRRYPSLVYDSARGRMVLHGGSPSGGGPQTAGETWRLDLIPAPSWSELSAPAPGRRYATAVFDAATERMVVFGGMQVDGLHRNDVWVRDLQGGTPWSALTPADPLPAPRWGQSAILDEGRHRMVVFGGIDGASSFNDLWALSLSASPAWSMIVPGGTPPAPRSGHAAVYDPIGDRMVVFGGADQQMYNDTWALTFSPVPAWSQLAPAGTPPGPRYWMAAAFDTKRRHMLVFGAVPIEGGGELWALSLAGTPAWTQIVVPGAPPPRFLSSAVYDPIGDRLIVFGGLSDVAGEGNAAWALTLSAPMVWTRLSPAGGLPGSRAAHSAVFDIAHNRMVTFGGFMPGQGINTVYYDDTWALAWEPPVATDVPPGLTPAAFALRGARPNPASRHIAISFSLAERGPATLELLDVTGRRLRTHEVGDPRAGAHLVEFDREIAGLETGVYLVRLRQGARTAATKICVVR